VTSRSLKARFERTRSRSVASASRLTRVTRCAHLDIGDALEAVIAGGIGLGHDEAKVRAATAAFSVAPGPSATTWPWLITTTRSAI